MLPTLSTQQRARTKTTPSSRSFASTSSTKTTSGRSVSSDERRRDERGAPTDMMIHKLKLNATRRTEMMKMYA